MEKSSETKKSLAERIQWLFTKDGLPVLVSIIVGIVIGFFLNGAAGLIVATLAGFAVLKLFNKLPFRTAPWQAMAIDLSPVVAKLLLSLSFLLPIANYLTLPSGHTPNTLPKYLSIVIMLPKNLFSAPPSDVFPGLVIIVVISIVLLYWGGLNLGKTRNWLIAFAGLLLYTFSPTITSAIKGNPALRILPSFFGVGYYFAWLGLLLMLVSKILPKILKTDKAGSRNLAGVLNLVPPLIAFGALSQLNTPGSPAHFNLFQAFDFESGHHLFAEIFSGGFAGIMSGVTVCQSKGTNPEPPLDPYAPVPSTDPEDPPGTTIQNNKDGSITKQFANGDVGTKYSDGTIEAQKADGTKVIGYPDGTTKAWYPNGITQVDHPDGTTEYWEKDGSYQIDRPNGVTEISKPDGRTGIIYPDGKSVTTTSEKEVITQYPNGTVTDTQPDGTSETWDKDGRTTSKTLGSSSGHPGVTGTFNSDGSVDMTDPQGGRAHFNTDGTFTATINGDTIHFNADGNPDGGGFHDKDGTLITYNKDSSADITINGEKVTVNSNLKPIGGSYTTPEGIKHSFNKDGSQQITDPHGGKMEVDSDGNPVSGSISDNNGNSMKVNPDGSIEGKTQDGDTFKGGDNGAYVKLKDGSSFNTDSSGNLTAAHFKNELGNTVDIKTDINGGTHASDNAGNSVDVNKDGSYKFKDDKGNTGSQDADGNFKMDQADGKKWQSSADGNSTISDSHGNTVTVGKDKNSYTLTEPGGKTTTLTAEQFGKLSPTQPTSNLADTFHSLGK